MALNPIDRLPLPQTGSRRELAWAYARRWKLSAAYEQLAEYYPAMMLVRGPNKYGRDVLNLVDADGIVRYEYDPLVEETMDQDYDRNAKNVVIREGEVQLERIAGVDGGLIRWGGKEYVLKDLLEVKDEAPFVVGETYDGYVCTSAGTTGGRYWNCIEGCQSGDCQCNKQMSRCCP